jgi:hypothetical protein
VGVGVGCHYVLGSCRVGDLAGVTCHSVTQKPWLRLAAQAFSKWKLGYRLFKAKPMALAWPSFFESDLASSLRPELAHH